MYLDRGNDGVWDGENFGIGGVTVQLQGTDVNSNTVVRTAVTGENGRYLFADLAAGEYTIWEVADPVGFVDGMDTVGSLGGTIANDLFTEVVLGWGVDGTMYNFGELLEEGEG